MLFLLIPYTVDSTSAKQQDLLVFSVYTKNFIKFLFTRKNIRNEILGIEIR